MKDGKNYITVFGWILANSMWDDGSIWIGRGRRIVWSYNPPLWIVNTYNRLASRWEE